MKNSRIKIEIVRGDITGAAVEVIVNAANNHLWMGSGVAGAIKRRGGSEIEKEAVAKGPLEIGQAVETSAGKLPYKYIIHAAGMGQDLQTSGDIVYRTTVNSLLLAERLQVKSIAFPAIGTGVGALAIENCAKIMIQAVYDLSEKLRFLERVQFVLFDQAAFETFTKTLEKYR